MEAEHAQKVRAGAAVGSLFMLSRENPRVHRRQREVEGSYPWHPLKAETAAVLGEILRMSGHG